MVGGCLERGAVASTQSVSAFVLQDLVLYAEQALAERGVIVMSPEASEAFDEALAAPPSRSRHAWGRLRLERSARSGGQAALRNASNRAARRSRSGRSSGRTGWLMRAPWKCCSPLLSIGPSI